MAERAMKRPAGVTRITNVRAADPRLTTADLSLFTRAELERVALDRGLSITGTDADVRTRILTDMGV